MTSDAEKKQQVADRIQRQMLREARQRLKEAQEALKISEAEVEDLRNKQEENSATVKTLAAKELAIAKTVAAATIDRKDATIEILKQRVKNLNEEYHDKVFARKATTLDDVYKITGEIE